MPVIDNLKRKNAKVRKPPRAGPGVILGAVICLGFVIVGLVGPLLIDFDPTRLDFRNRLQPPSISYPFGTDEMGRDLFKAVLVGAQISLWVASLIILSSGAIGVIVGLIAGYGGGAVDNLIMRITDVFLGFPTLVLAMVVSVVLGGGLFPAVVGMAVVWWPGYARLIRGPVLSLKESLYVEAARASGASHASILFRHILPGVASPILVKAASDVGYAILFTASLSFIGLGARPPSPEWGRLVVAGRDYLQDYWWYATFPGLAIFIVVLGFNLVGDYLRDWLDPRGRQLS